MQIYGIGTDILNIMRIEKIFHKAHYQRFYYKILSKNEIKAFILLKNDKEKATYLAKRFSVKEAVLKALGTGYRLGIAFNEIETFQNDFGKPGIKLLGQTLQIFQKMIEEEFTIFVSWSDEYPYIVSFAVIQII